MRLDEYAKHDGLALAGLVRRGETTPAELCHLALAAIEKVNPVLNGVLETFRDRADPDRLSRLPDGPFRGVPFLIKDLGVFEKGVKCECGSELMRGYVADHDSDIVKRFRRAGLVTLGRSAVPEMGYSSATSSKLHGLTRNPWHPDRISGGSSGGAAVSVASGVVPMAHGSDAGGSIRSPASFNGLVGLKPSRGRVSAGPDAASPLSGLNIDFALTRTVRDCAALLDSIQGYATGDPYEIRLPERPFMEEVGAPPGDLRIAVATRSLSGAPYDPAVLAAVERTARLLESMGFAVEQAVPAFDWEPFISANNDVWTAHLAHDCDTIGRALGRRPGPETLQRVTLACYEHGKSVGGGRYLQALDVFNSTSRRIGAFFEGHDVLVTPTCTRLAMPHDEFDADRDDMDALSWCRHCFALEAFLVPFNVTGQPAISLPLHEAPDGSQIGIQFVSGFGGEATLFRLAAALEDALPWRDRRPPMHIAN